MEFKDVAYYKLTGAAVETILQVLADHIAAQERQIDYLTERKEAKEDDR